MLEYDKLVDICEPQPLIEHWRYISPGSAYACSALGEDCYIVGGADWDRRNTPFTETTRNAQGLITKISRQNGVIINDGQLLFPSMVNALVPMNDCIFVGCKSRQGAFNLVDKCTMGIMYSADDAFGNGVYNALFHQASESLFVTTRTGWLQRINPSDLTVDRSMCLSGCASRLWSLAVDEQGVVFSGDYHGRLYMVSEDMSQAKIVNLPLLLDDYVSKEQRRYDPSVFGLVVLDNNRIVASIRWGQLFLFEYSHDSIRLSDTLTIPEEISDLGSIPDSDDILVGTRSGTLLRTDFSETRPLLSIPPSYQLDNSIWSITHTQQGEHIVVFADGQVVSIGLGD